jgi:hypothetical protein
MACSCYFPPGSTQTFQVEELDQSGKWWSLPSSANFIAP